MRSRYLVHNSHAAHFITCTVLEWLPIFTTAARCDIVADALAYCQANNGLQIHAWVILDTHLHAIVSASDSSRVRADLKRHTTKMVLTQLAEAGPEWLVNQLAYYRAKHKKQSVHQLWQDGFHPQELLSDAMMQQKVDYIHANPVRRGLVAAPKHWRYSSTHELLGGAMPLLRCDPWK